MVTVIRRSNKTPENPSKIDFNGIAGQGASIPQPEPGKPLNEPKKDYKAIFRTAFEFLDKYKYLPVQGDYWQNHIPGVDDPPPTEIQYWGEMGQEASDLANKYLNDQFLTDLLIAIIDELERQHDTALGIV